MTTGVPHSSLAAAPESARQGPPLVQHLRVHNKHIQYIVTCIIIIGAYPHQF